MADKLRQIQQGDVLLQEVTEIPSDASLEYHEGPVILARGESTGHCHCIESDRAKLWTLTRDGVAEIYLEVQAPVTLNHDEHKPLPIPVGIYRVGRVKEYDYFALLERPIED
jgi:hypothetical protein